MQPCGGGGRWWENPFWGGGIKAKTCVIKKGSRVMIWRKRFQVQKWHVQSLRWHWSIQCPKNIPGTLLERQPKGAWLCRTCSLLIAPPFLSDLVTCYSGLPPPLKPLLPPYSPSHTRGILQPWVCSAGSSLCLECSSIDISLSNCLIPSNLCSYFTFYQACLDYPHLKLSHTFLPIAQPHTYSGLFLLFFPFQSLLLMYYITYNIFVIYCLFCQQHISSTGGNFVFFTNVSQVSRTVLGTE